jgi:Arc/MetJ-type ribon-helix-helix transcriptional regulator
MKVKNYRTIGDNLVAFKMPKELYEKVRALADLKYYGNQSMVIRIALMEYFERPEIKQLLKAQAPSPQRPTPREPSSIGGERA